MYVHIILLCRLLLEGGYLQQARCGGMRQYAGCGCMLWASLAVAPHSAPLALQL